MNANLFARLLPALERSPGRTLLTWRGIPVPAAALLDETNRMAGRLHGLGLEPGDRIAVQVEKSPEAVAVYLAALRLGAIYLPLNNAYTTSELAYFLDDAEPRIVVCDPASEAALAPIAARTEARVATLGVDGEGSLQEHAAADSPAVAEAEADDVAAILYTSGTTGRSKGAMLSHRNLWSNTGALIDAWGFSESDVLIHALPLFHTHGLFVALNMTFAAGASLHLLPKFDPDEILRLMPVSTVLMGVPTFYTRLLAHPGLTREATASMRLFVSGSAPLLAETHRAFTQATGHAILERYGMTETGMNLSNPLHGERRPGSVGLPLPGIEARITDAEGRPQPPGEIGGLEIRGPNVFKGYWRMPEKTEAEFRPDGFFITGDLAVEAEDGYVTIVGRSKDLIITGGYNVYPKEVEDLLNDLPGVAESAVIGVPHPDLGEAVVAIVVPEPGVREVEAAVLDGVARSLAGFKRPKRVLVRDALPRNTMGKVQKTALRDQCAGLFG